MFRSLCIAAAVLAARPPLLACDPVITEFLAVNESGLLDEDGDSSDWIEIYNPCADAVDLEGWHLTDNRAHLEKWRFPEVVLDAGAYLIVFASEKDRTAPELHANFRLDRRGEYLGLVAPDGTITSEFAPQYPRQRADFSYGHGRQVLGDPLVARGDVAAIHVPTNGSLGRNWTGSSADEPFDDSPASGWHVAPMGIGFDDGGGGAEPAAPLAYWTFDGNALDQADGPHETDLHGTDYSEDTPEVFGIGQSLDFDGVGDYVSAFVDVSETRYTTSMWFKTRSSGRGLFAVVDSDLGGGGHDRHIYLNGGNAATRVWNNETITSRGKNYADGRWHHIAHVVGSPIGGQRIYVDGQLIASGSKARSDFDWQRRINIGFSNDAAQPYFDGLIDDVAVWSDVLTSEQVGNLADGASPLALNGVSPFVVTDITGEMLGVSTSLYLRVPFSVTLPIEFDALELHIRYDDGFLAYLNGVEVARRNAPSGAAFDSAALTDRPVHQAVRVEVIDLGEQMDLLTGGDNILAIHAINESAESPDFLIDLELLQVVRSTARFLTPPTPGAANALGVTGFVADTTFSVDRGFYEEPFAVEITTATDEASIYFTKDGSEPRPENPAARLYTASVPIDTTTTLRAAAFKDGFQPTNVDTQTYVFLDDVLRQPSRPAGTSTTWSGGFPADYAVDPDVVNSTLPGYSVREALVSVPTISVSTDPDNLFLPGGIYYNSGGRGPAWERAASVELIYPDGRKGFQVGAGIRMHGNSSRNHAFTPKHPMRLMFKSQFGTKKLNFKLFEDSDVDRFDQLLLRGASTDSWPVVTGNFVLGVQRWNPLNATYIRDQYMRDSQNAMGRPSGHGLYVQLYLNGLYWGLYNLAERPVNSFNAEHVGGDKEEYDVLKDFAELQAGQRAAWDAMIAMANAGLGSTTAYQRIQGNNPDGTPNPSFPHYLDVDNLIDYMILHIHAGAEDWPDHNWWAARRRGPESEGFKFFVWDQEISNDSLVRTHTRMQTRFEDPISSPSPSFLYGRLMANPDFRQTFIDRVHKHLFGAGILTPEKGYERWRKRAEEIDRAIVGESARWGDSKKAVPYKREVEWLAEWNWMRERYFPEIQPIAVERFRRVGLYPDVESPVFEIEGVAQPDGAIRSGDSLTMVVPTAPSFVDAILVDRDNTASALVPSDDSLGTSWRDADYVEGTRGESWRAGQNGVGYENGSGYEGVIRVDVGDEMSGGGGNNTVYVRLPFDIEDQGVINATDRLTLRIAFDDGFVAWLNGTRIADANAPAGLTWNSSSTTGGETNLLAPPEFDITEFRGRLRVGGNVLAVQGLNFNTTSTDMLVLPELIAATLDDAPPPDTVLYTLDGSDPMDAAAIPYAGPVVLDETTLVKARALDGGEWSALNEALYFVDRPLTLRITEILYHPIESLVDNLYAASEFEFIELQNVGDTPLALSGVRITGGVEFQFSKSVLSTLEPRELVVIVRNLDAFATRYDVDTIRIAGAYRGRLDNSGESLRLAGPLGNSILDFTYDDAWYPSTDGAGFSLVTRNAFAPTTDWDSLEGWRPSELPGGSPGLPDGDIEPGGVVRPGDANQDGVVDLSDGIQLLLRLFGGLDSPLPCEGVSMEDGGNVTFFDTNGDRGVDVSDAIHLLEFLFRSGPAPSGGTTCRFAVGCEDSCLP